MKTKNLVVSIKSLVSSIGREQRAVFGKRNLYFSRLIQSCILLLVTCFFLSSCGGDDDETIAPKPRAYFRLTFPEKKYVMYDSVCPFKFEMPVYAKMVKDPHPGAEPCWLNLDFPTLNATVHLSYESVNATNLGSYLQNTYELVSKHEIKASRIQDEVVSKDKQKVYGLIYDIDGNAASRIQFFLTDSTSNFIRGALYFNAVPNSDSIKPCVDFIKKDIYHMIETFEWKNNVAKPAVISKSLK